MESQVYIIVFAGAPLYRSVKFVSQLRCHHLLQDRATKPALCWLRHSTRTVPSPLSGRSITATPPGLTSVHECSTDWNAWLQMEILPLWQNGLMMVLCRAFIIFFFTSGYQNKKHWSGSDAVQVLFYLSICHINEYKRCIHDHLL